MIKSDELLEFARILGHQSEFQEVLRLVAQRSAQLLKADLSLILMLNPDTRKTVKTIFREGKSIQQKEYRDIHIHVGGWIVSKKTSFFTLDIRNDDRFSTGLFDQVPVKCIAGVPLFVEGIIIGALIVLYRTSVGGTGDGLISSLENIAVISAPFLRNSQKIREFFQSSLPGTSLLVKYNNAGLYGRSATFIEMLHAVEAATKCDARVLLIGETGTGKELIARAMHTYSARSRGPFVAVNCGAIPKDLLESEFFGHTRGAFTGAHSERKGLFLEADGGTLFLDEINNLSFEMQSKLLRVLEESEVRPVGSDKTVNTNVRVVAASSVSLKKLVEQKEFREDLFFRLYVYPVYIPGLNDRNEDIPILSHYFLNTYAEKQHKKARKFHEEVMDFMKQRNWEGNIRELENFVERLVTIIPTESGIIEPDIFPGDMKPEFDTFRKENRMASKSMSVKEQLNCYEAEIIQKALIECNWNQSLAARQLQTSESNIRYKMIQYQIKRPSR